MPKDQKTTSKDTQAGGETNPQTDTQINYLNNLLSPVNNLAGNNLQQFKPRQPLMKFVTDPQYRIKANGQKAKDAMNEIGECTKKAIEECYSKKTMTQEAYESHMQKLLGKKTYITVISYGEVEKIDPFGNRWEDWMDGKSNVGNLFLQPWQKTNLPVNFIATPTSMQIPTAPAFNNMLNYVNSNFLTQEEIINYVEQKGSLLTDDEKLKLGMEYARKMGTFDLAAFEEWMEQHNMEYYQEDVGSGAYWTAVRSKREYGWWSYKNLATPEDEKQAWKLWYLAKNNARISEQGDAFTAFAVGAESAAGWDSMYDMADANQYEAYGKYVPKEAVYGLADLRRKVMDNFPTAAGLGELSSMMLQYYIFLTATDLLDDYLAGIPKTKLEGTGKKIINTVPAEKVNAEFAKDGYKPPYTPGTQTNTIEITQKTKTGEFVRVYDKVNSGIKGGWVMRAEDIKGLTPAQIQNKFALKYTPTHIADVNFNPGDILRTGTANGIFGFDGGGVQYDLLGQFIGDFTNGRLLSTK